MTLCIYSLPPQNPSIHVNSRQELLTIYPISIPGNHQGHQKQGVWETATPPNPQPQLPNHKPASLHFLQEAPDQEG